jgi:hypothetical protein
MGQERKDIGRANLKSDLLGDSASRGLIQQLIETTGDMLELEWQGSVLTN